MTDPNKKCLDGITCSVNECHFYENGDKCTAAHVDVKGVHADTSDDTRCQTFKPNGMM